MLYFYVKYIFCMKWLFISLTAVLDVISSIVIKEWTINGHIGDLMLGVLALAASGVAFSFSMRYFGLAISNILWNSFSTIVLTGVAFFLFHEKLTAQQLIGIGVILCGVILVGK